MNCIPLLCDVVLDQFEFRQDTDHVMGTDATIPVSQRSLPSQIFEAVREIISIIKVHGKQYFPPRPHMTQYYALIWPTIEQVCRNGSLASFADKLLEDVEKCRNKWPFVGSAENHVWKLLASSLRARRVLAQNKSFMESAAPKPRKKKRGAVLPEDTYSAEKVAELLCGHGLIMDAKILLSRN
ncbi:hypothetical protein BC829DRAFT_44832 [Chytridium lagenaria]|nr:hypothetical protein BC829DRAFT_44832 [Chytridium lagenaria]